MTDNMPTWPDGARVYVLNEGPGTVVNDHGWDKRGRRIFDLGVDVRADSDGVVVSAAHVQVERED